MAGNAGGIRAGQAYVEAYADTSKLESGLKKAAGTLKGFASGLRTIFASAFGPVGTAINALAGTVEGPLVDAFSFISDSTKGLFADTLIEKFGAGFSEAGLAVKEVWELVYTQIGRVVEGILQNLQPAFGRGLNVVRNLLEITKQWLTKNEEVISTFIKIATSGEVLWSGLKLAWTEGTVALATTWNNFLNDMVQGAVASANAIAGAFGGDAAFNDAGFGASTTASNAKLADDLDKARKDFADAVARAKLRNIDPKAKAVGDGAQAAFLDAKERRSVIGTFSARAVGGLDGGGTASRIADNTMNTARGIQKLLLIAKNKGKFN